MYTSGANNVFNDNDWGVGSTWQGEMENLGGIIDLKKGGYTSLEKFRLIAAATIKILEDYVDGSTEKYILNRSQLTHMLGLVEKIPDYEYKNPSAFAIGYTIAINSNYTTLQIDEQTFTVISTINNKIDDKSYTFLSDSDIIRYARLCLLNKIK